MTILLVWEENPEGCKFFLGEEGSALHRLVAECDGLFINGDPIPDGHLIYELNDLIPELNAIASPIQFQNISAVYYCGFIL